MNILAIGVWKWNMIFSCS